MQASLEPGKISVIPASTTTNGTQSLTLAPFTFNVVSNTNFPTTGYLSVVVTIGTALVQYTGKGVNTFTGCTTGATYTSNTGSAVISTYNVNNTPITSTGTIFGTNVSYLPSVPGNWTPTVPTTLSQGLDLVAGGEVTQLGTITTGTWNAGIISGTYGGFGVNNGIKTLTLGGNLSTGGPLAITGTAAASQILTGTGAGNASWVGNYTTTATAAGTTTLTTSSTYQQYFTGTNTQTVVLPANSTAGNRFSITNLSTGLVTITASGGNVLSILQPGSGIGGSTNILTCIVTNGTDYNSWSGGNVETIAVGSTPFAVCFDGTNIWVANSGSNNVTKISATTNNVIGTYTVGTTPMGICSDGTNIWVLNTGSLNVTKLSASTGATIGTYGSISGSAGTTLAFICFDGTYLWVAAGGTNLNRITASTGAIATFATGVNPCSACFDGTYLWVACITSRRLYKHSVQTGAVLSIVDPFNSWVLTSCFDGTNIWVSGQAGAKLAKINPWTNAVLANAIGPSECWGMCSDGTYIWASVNNTGLTKILASTGAVVGVYNLGITYPVGNTLMPICFDGTNIWAVNPSANIVMKLTQPNSVSQNNIQSRNIGVPLLSSYDNVSLDLNANTQVNNLNNGYQTTVTAAGTTTLSVISGKMQYFTGSTTQTVVMPVPSTLINGQKYKLVNQSSGAIAVQSNPVTITAATTGVNPTIYTANNTFTAGQIVTITGVNPVAYNLTSATISAANATTFRVATTVTGPYISGGTATVNITSLAVLGSTNGWAYVTCVDNTGVTGIAGWSCEGGGIVII